jgi:hypothetical protein
VPPKKIENYGKRLKTTDYRPKTAEKRQGCLTRIARISTNSVAVFQFVTIREIRVRHFFHDGFEAEPGEFFTQDCSGLGQVLI